MNLKDKLKISVSLSQPRNAAIYSGENGENATLATVIADISLADGTPLITKLRGRLYAYAAKGQSIGEVAPKIDFTNPNRFSGTDGKEVRLNSLVLNKELEEILLFEAIKTLNEVGYKSVDEVDAIANATGATKEEISTLMKSAVQKALVGREVKSRTTVQQQSLSDAARTAAQQISSESLPTD